MSSASPTYKCPVCDWDMESPAKDYSICSQCGTELGYDDQVLTHAQLREEWIAKGRPFFFEEDAPK